MIKSFKETCQSAFKNDIIKSTNDLLVSLNEIPHDKRIEIISSYIAALTVSKYNDKELYSKIISKIDIPDITEIWSIITKDNNQSVVVFAKTLKQYLASNTPDHPLIDKISNFISTSIKIEKK